MKDHEGFTHDDLQYTRRLQKRATWWKQAIGVDRWYGHRARRATTGRTLEVGCGIGRLLQHLGSDAVGVDTNSHSVAVAAGRGLTAMTPGEFTSSDLAAAGSFHALLFAHVLEHMTIQAATDLVGEYLPYLESGGRVVVVVPQEAGFASDPTHVEFVDIPQLEQIADAHGLRLASLTSFPFPRSAGRLFRYNETIAIMIGRPA